MQRALLALFALLVLLLAAAGLMFFRFGATEELRVAEAERAAAAEAAARAEAELRDAEPAEAPVGPSPTQEVPEVDERIAAEPTAAVDEEWDLTDAAELQVTVAFDPATPADDRAELLFFTQAQDANDLSREVVRLIEGEPRRVRHRQPAVAGTQTIQLPADVRVAHVAVAGRYTRSRETVRVRPGEAVEVPVELGAWIVGRLVPPADASEEERDFDGVDLDLMGDPMQVINRGAFMASDVDFAFDGETRPDGSFEFRAVPPGAGYRLSGRPDALAAFRSDAVDLEAGGRVDLEIPLVRGAWLAGAVVDSEGERVPDARLAVVQNPIVMDQGGQTVRRMTSDSDGTFKMKAVAAGPSKLQASAHGYLESKVEIEVPESGELTGLEVVLTRGSRLAGIVKWPDGSPVEDADVDVRFDMSAMAGMGAFNAMHGANGSADSDADGRFEVTGLGKGPFTIRAEAPDPDAGDEESEPVIHRARLDGLQPDTEDIELVLLPPLAVAGRVVDDLGEPLTRFRVSAVLKGKGMLATLGADTEESSFEDDEGRFRLEGVREGAWTLVARAEGHGKSEEVVVDVPQAEGEDVLIAVPRAASVSGVVLGPAGRPVEGAEVSLQFAMSDFANMDARNDLMNRPRAATEADGSFLLEGLTPGALTIEATHERYAVSSGAPVELEASEQVEGVVLTLREGGTLTGEVFDAEGEPDVGRQVLAQIPAGRFEQRYVTTDGDGEFVLEHVTPGSWQVMTFNLTDMQAPTEGSDDAADMSKFLENMKFTMAEVKDGETTHVTLGAPPADPVRVHGLVTLGGEPVPGLIVTFFADTSGAASAMEAMKFKSTDDEGRFEIVLDEPGTFMVNVQAVGPDGTQQSLEFFRTIPDEEDVDVELQLPVGGIAGRVLGPDGSPAGGVRVSLGTDGPLRNGSFAGGRYSEITTEPDGTYRMTWLRAGTYTVSAGGTFLGGMFGGDGSQGARVVRGGVRVPEGQWVEGLDFRLPKPGVLVGRVVDRTGSPVPEAAIFIRDENGVPLERITMTQTGADGKFRYTGIAPGSYSVAARVGDQATPRDVTANVRSDQEESVELALEAGTMLVISVVGEAGELVDATLLVEDGQGRQVNGLFSMNELMQAFTSTGFSTREQRVGPLAPGSYKVTASAPDGRSVTKPVTLSGQAERKLKLRLK